ncbi:hypothetical protein AOLI_G00269510 [Acnodon oligacanthus]
MCLGEDWPRVLSGFGMSRQEEHQGLLLGTARPFFRRFRLSFSGEYSMTEAVTTKGDGERARGEAAQGGGPENCL